jgi:hypothetical protein
MNKAPVHVSVFDRPNHFRACIESLKKNKGAEDTVLYIASDGPVCGESAKKVSEVRNYIKGINGFRKIHVFAPKDNSQKKVIFDSRESMLADNKIFIASEDDNVFSPWFLAFVNNGLAHYQDNQNVFAICGYNYPGFPLDGYVTSVPLQDFAAWGYGSWRDRNIINQDFDQKKLMTEIFAKRKIFSAINHTLPHMAPMMKYILDGKLRAGDVSQAALLFKENKVCIFPSKSLVRNVGHDGSGEHCGVDDLYSSQEIFTKHVPINYQMSIVPSDVHSKWVRNFLGGYKGIALGWLIFWQVNSRNGFVRWLISNFILSLKVMRSVRSIIFHR